jgi:peptidoglycan/xylan/chitin deacetylase (PgdA/CDA1 family)
MKGKYAVLVVLALLLIFTVWSMLRMQDRMPLVLVFNPRSGSITPPARAAESLRSLTPAAWQKLTERTQYFTRVQGDQIEILTSSRKQDLTPQSQTWSPLFLKGFNLGPALPGTFPGEFRATAQQYREWLDMMGDLGVNLVRVYTILPPHFYEALAQYNFAHGQQPLYLLQGIWADQAQTSSYGDSSYLAEFQAEIRRAVDVIHGHAVLTERPGHASGQYSTNVSRYTLAFVLGREWEPETVTAMRQRFPERTSYQGTFFIVPKAQAMECWIAEALDYTANYETQNYQFQHALSFVNWLPLDPLYHDSEWIEWDNVREYDNDLETLDPNLIGTTPLFKAGYFASYHAYPYYPDFVYNDESYRRASCDSGLCTYAGYLQDLVQAHPGLPVVIGEFGVPTSRSASHFASNGMNQGGHDEMEQGKINAHMIHDIWKSGCAGAVVFAWMDEWFKHNWLVMDYELPAERNPLWHNLEDPEQNFGILAMEAQERLIDGRDGDWIGQPLAQTPAGEVGSQPGTLKALWAAVDASCLYLKLDFIVPLRLEDFEGTAIWIGLDTYDRQRGDHYFPDRLCRAPSGLEFVVRLSGPQASVLLVDEPYDIFTDLYRDSIPGYTSRFNENGVYHEERLLANRPRETLTGEMIPQHNLNRSHLIWGSAKPGDPNYTSQADVCLNPEGRFLELRLPWALLNVTDPSSQAVLDNDPATVDLDYMKTEGFQIYAVVSHRRGAKQHVTDTFPEGLQQGIPYLWAGWNDPKYRSRLKEGAGQVAQAFRKISRYAHLPFKVNSTPPTARICAWPKGSPQAVSVTFDDGSANQMQVGRRLLEKYGFHGTFFVVTSWTGHSPMITGEAEGLTTRRLSIPEVQELHLNGHEIGSHSHLHRPLAPDAGVDWIESTYRESQMQITSWIGSPALSVSYPYARMSGEGKIALAKLGFRFGRRGGDQGNYTPLQAPLNLYSYVIIDDRRPSPATFRDIINTRSGQWFVLQYHHLFPVDAREYLVMEAHRVEDTYNVTPRTFERQMRLLRNSGAFEGTMSEIGLYNQAANGVRLEFTVHDRSLVAALRNIGTDSLLTKTPLTLEVTSSWPWLKIEGSLEDGLRCNRTGVIRFEALPGSEIIMRREP